MYTEDRKTRPFIYFLAFLGYLYINGSSSRLTDKKACSKFFKMFFVQERINFYLYIINSESGKIRLLYPWEFYRSAVAHTGKILLALPSLKLPDTSTNLMLRKMPPGNWSTQWPLTWQPMIMSLLYTILMVIWLKWWMVAAAMG